MRKTLEQAIGCWTVNRAYNSLPVLAGSVLQTAKRCTTLTTQKKADPSKLMEELIVLRKRIASLNELNEAAIKRLMHIIAIDELSTETEEEHVI